MPSVRTTGVFLKIAPKCSDSFSKNKGAFFRAPMRAAHLWPENVIRSLGGREIKLVMLAAAWIKCCATMRASVAARHVLVDGHFISANAAEHGGLGPLHLRPDLDRMAG